MNDRTQWLRNGAQSSTTVIDGTAHGVLRNTYFLLPCVWASVSGSPRPPSYSICRIRAS